MGQVLVPTSEKHLQLKTDADFLAKIYVSFKEANETAYWLELPHESDYLDKKTYISIYSNCQEIIKMLASITKTQKKKIEQSK